MPFIKGYHAWNKGLIGYRAGILQSEEHKRKIHEARKLNPCCGEKSSVWKGGFSKTVKYHVDYCKKWRKNNPERVSIYQRKYKAQRKSAGDLSLKKIQMVYEDNIKHYGTLTCYLCKNPIEFKKDSLEHKIPICRGGTNEYENLAIACQPCNSKKGTKTVEEYKENMK